MSWSKSQQIAIHKAAKAAGWNPQQRYIAMRHAGCPNLRDSGSGGRPSVSHPRNSNRHYELVMVLAEAQALTRGLGDDMPRPGRGGFWKDSASDQRWREIEAVRKIAHEAIERMPKTFDPYFLAGFIARMTRHDDKGFASVACPKDLTECDEGQIYRIHEGLKAWVGRELADRGMAPRSFRWHGRREGEAEAA